MLWTFIALLVFGATALSAAECPFSGTSYTSPYNSPIGLPRCSDNAITKWGVCEVCLISNGNFTAQAAYTSSYLPPPQVSLQPVATFQLGATTRTVNGFFDGIVSNKAVFRIRFTPPVGGTWSYTTSSSDSGLTVSSPTSFFVGASARRGMLRRDAARPERFIFDNGGRFFMWGQTYYQLITKVRNGTPDEWKTSIDNSVAKGMNKLRTLLYPFGNFLPYGDSLPFSDGDTHDVLDLAHWRRFDEIPNYLNQKGMIAEIIVFNDNNRAYSKPLGDAMAQMRDQRYMRYAIARYAAFPNVIFSLTNEWNLSPYGKAYWNTMGSIAREDPWLTQGSNLRLLSIHPRTDHLFQFFDATWPVHAVIQDGTNNGRLDANNIPQNPPHFDNGDEWGNYSIANNLGRGMPVVNDEYGYIGDTQTKTGPFDRLEHRQAMWGIAFAGGYGSAGSLRVLNGQQITITGDWQDEPEYADVLALTRFFTVNVPNWWQMSRNTTIPNNQSRVYAMSEPGVRFVVYSAQGSTVSLDIPAPPQDHVWSYCFINPQTGNCTDKFLRTHGGGDNQQITLPSNQDWALLFEVY
jgi:Protein of unknown function (DUF4038)/Domain of unknown function (DUF5060)